MKKYSVNLLTPPRLGGPFYWAQNLVRLLNTHAIPAHHIFQLKDLVLSPFFQNSDIVHAALPLGIRLWRHKFVLTIKGDYMVEKRRWRYLNTRATRIADAVTVPSHFLKEKLGLSDAIVIPNAIFTGEFLPVHHQDKSMINLVTVTNFAFKDKSEGIVKIAEYLESVQKSTDRKINYTIVGGGPYLPTVQQNLKDINIPITFTGFIPNPRAILQENDIFVYYSIHDNFPNVFLEAMASGLPIVTNNVGASAEILESGISGYIASDDSTYQQHLNDLISSSTLRSTMGANARRRTEERFTWERIIFDYISLYEKVLE